MLVLSILDKYHPIIFLLPCLYFLGHVSFLFCLYPLSFVMWSYWIGLAFAF